MLGFIRPRQLGQVDSMFKIASKCAYRVAVCAPAEVAAYSSIATSSSVLKQGTQAALIPICSWFASSSAAVGIPRAQQSFCPAATAGAHRWRTGLAQREDPVEEKSVDEMQVDQKAANSSDAKTFESGHIAPDPGHQTKDSTDSNQQNEVDAEWALMQPVYDREYTETVKPIHVPAENVHQKLANFAVFCARHFFDTITSYNLENMTERKWLRRILFLETVAGVPGMVGGMLRHMSSLRSMRRDNGWIHTLLEEAENERMHLLTFLELRQPGHVFRALVLISQGMFFNAYFVAYLISPKLCHTFVGYLEEEAVKTYTHCISDLDQGRLPGWSTKKVPDIACDYWKLGKDATMRDLLLSVRADEACHSHVNHTFSELGPSDKNPFAVGTHVVPKA